MGGSVAGIVVIALITTVVVWCWRTGKCRVNGNSVGVDENEMYGREDYYDYHQDTMVADENDYYGGGDMYESD